MEGEYGIQRLFWFDEWPASNAEAMARAQWYGMPGYSYIRVDGTQSLVTMAGCGQVANLLRPMIDARLAETGDLSPLAIDGRFLADNTELTFDVTMKLVDPFDLGDFRATFVALEDSVGIQLPFGGDSTMTRVAQAYHYEPMPAMSPGDSVRFVFSIPRDPSWKTDQMWGIVFVQQLHDPKAVAQSRILSRSSAGVGPANPRLPASASRIETVLPNPFRNSAEIRFSVSGASAAGSVRLDIFDSGGREVRRLFEGSAAPGIHTQSWNGRAADGEAVRSGVYFAQLTTLDGRSQAKLIVLP